MNSLITYLLDIFHAHSELLG